AQSICGHENFTA
ncbi:unnamed protein product, partial [Allacma fusca]